MVKTPDYFNTIIPFLHWSVKTKSNTVFLTFDDGPVPGVTDKVLDLLKEYNQKATFFCVGTNAQNFPELILRIISEGHSIGNHTLSHLNGWKTNKIKYINNWKACNDVLFSITNNSVKYFRPPYGKINIVSIPYILKTQKIIMWDVLSMDFKNEMTTENCYNSIIKNQKTGSIIVLHDSIKCNKIMLPTLEKILMYYKLNHIQSASLESWI